MGAATALTEQCRSERGREVGAYPLFPSFCPFCRFLHVEDARFFGGQSPARSLRLAKEAHRRREERGEERGVSLLIGSPVDFSR